MSRFFDVALTVNSSNYIYLNGIKIDSQYVNSALPNIKLNLNSRTEGRTKVRKKGGIVGC
jgi:hypothetical protein